MGGTKRQVSEAARAAVWQAFVRLLKDDARFADILSKLGPPPSSSRERNIIPANVLVLRAFDQAVKSFRESVRDFWNVILLIRGGVGDEHLVDVLVSDFREHLTRSMHDAE